MTAHMKKWGAVYILTALFILSWIGQAVAQVLWVGETGDEFWAATFENWQSEWLQLAVQAAVVVGAAAILFRKSIEDLQRLERKVDRLLSQSVPSAVLKDGQQTNDRRLDRIWEEDWRALDYMLRPALSAREQTKPRSYTWNIPGGTVLDQGQEGACVGAGYTHELLARPFAIKGLDMQFARTQIYHEAQKDDPWAGGAYPGATPFYEGTSTMSGARVCAKLGYFKEYRWAMTTDELAMGVAYRGPAVIGVAWYSGMFGPDADGFLHPTGNVEGGHCVSIVGVKIAWTRRGTNRTWADVDREKSYFTILNSWGKDWGNEGRAKITLAEFDTLIDQGEFCIPITRAKAA